MFCKKLKYSDLQSKILIKTAKKHLLKDYSAGLTEIKFKTESNRAAIFAKYLFLFLRSVQRQSKHLFQAIVVRKSHRAPKVKLL